MFSVHLGLGSNLGAREQSLARARAALLARGVGIEARSSLYLTEPVGGPPQDWYLNQALRARTALPPEALLAACLAVEAELGRVRSLRFGPRAIDVDVLLCGDELRDSAELTLPHPRLHERRFVLVPLAELDPELRHPRLGLTVAELLARCRDPSRVLPAPSPSGLDQTAARG